MMRSLILAGLAIGILGTSGSGDELRMAGGRQPVLVELFTSEGCSSCPPADSLLASLDRTQPVESAAIIVLSEHVDYWNHIGWADPYSSPAFSARQQQYARRFRLEGPYTPQMVVDGQTELLGSDGHGAVSAIRTSSRQPRTAVRIGAGDRIATIEVDPLPAKTAHKANVYLVYAADSGMQDVARGENRGRRLHHVAIAKEVKQIGTVDDHSGFQTQVPVESGMRLVVFVQEAGYGPVWGAALRPAAR
jgi:hypothetical protein